MIEPPSAEQKAREMIERIGVDDASSFSAGAVAELANLIDALEQTRDELSDARYEVARLNALDHESKRALDKYNSELRVENAALRESNERLREELANEQARGIHSCHPNCTRDGCVNRRLRGLLRESLAWFAGYMPRSFVPQPTNLMYRMREELGEG